MHPVRQLISAYSDFSEAEWEQVAASLELRTVAPGTLVLEASRVCRHLYFLESGLLRFFI